VIRNLTILIFFAILDNTYAQNVIEIYPDDLHITNGGRLKKDSDGDSYIEYPSICIKSNSQSYSQIKAFMEGYYRYKDPTYAFSTQYCEQIYLTHFTETKLNFDLKGFPANAVLNLEVFYFSKNLKEEFDSYGNHFSSKGYGTSGITLAGTSTYRTYNGISELTIETLPTVGEYAVMSKKVPIGINHYLMKNITSQYRIGKIKPSERNYTLNINVDSGKINLADYYYADDVINKIQITQYRRPILGSEVIGGINTVFLMRLMMSQGETERICSEYSKQYRETKTSVDESEFYTNFIEKITDQNSSDLQTIVLSFYYESQREIEKTIDYLDSSFPELGVEKDLLIEGMQAVSIIRGNPCLQETLTLDGLRTDPEGSINQINDCFEKNAITSVQKTILEQLVSLGVSQTHVSSNFESEVRKMARIESKKRQKLINLKNKIKTFYYQGIPSMPLRAYCKKSMGSDAQGVLN
jgi:hypothetical protein